jgi:large repetitive protein
MQPDPLASFSEAISDALGRFELRGLERGRYSLSATARGLAPASAGPFDLDEGARRDDVAIVLSKGAVIYGKVLDLANAPIVGAMITTTKMGSVTPQITVTESDGSYRIEGLSGGAYQVTKLSAMMLGSSDMTADILKGMQTKTATLAEGQELQLDFIDSRKGGVLVTGKVLVDGKPKGSVLVHFAPESENDDDGATAERLHMATTDADGSYTIDSLNPGEWSVTVQSIADFSDTLRQTFEIVVTPTAQQVHDFALSRTGIDGIVRRRADGKPIPGARISIDAIGPDVRMDPFSKRAGSQRTGELFADAEGRYRMSGMQAGRYRVTAGGLSLMNLGGGNFARSPAREITLSDGETLRNVDFELGDGGAVQGTVIAAGSGSEGASIFFLKDGGEVVDMDPFSTTLTDGAGAYLADGLEGGTYTVAAKVAGFAPAWRRGVDVRVGETATVDLSLTEGTPFQLTVVDAAGADITNQCSIRVLTADGLDLTQLRSLSDFMSLALGGDPKDVTRLGHGTYTVEVKRGEVVKRVEINHGAASGEHVVVLE